MPLVQEFSRLAHKPSGSGKYFFSGTVHLPQNSPSPSPFPAPPPLITSINSFEICILLPQTQTAPWRLDAGHVCPLHPALLWVVQTACPRPRSLFWLVYGSIRESGYEMRIFTESVQPQIVLIRLHKLLTHTGFSLTSTKNFCSQYQTLRNKLQVDRTAQSTEINRKDYDP